MRLPRRANLSQATSWFFAAAERSNRSRARATPEIKVEASLPSPQEQNHGNEKHHDGNPPPGVRADVGRILKRNIAAAMAAPFLIVGDRAPAVWAGNLRRFVQLIFVRRIFRVIILAVFIVIDHEPGPRCLRRSKPLNRRLRVSGTAANSGTMPAESG